MGTIGSYDTGRGFRLRNDCNRALGLQATIEAVWLDSLKLDRQLPTQNELPTHELSGYSYLNESQRNRPYLDCLWLSHGE